MLRIVKFELDGTELFGEAAGLEPLPHFARHHPPARRALDDSSKPARDVPKALRERFLRLRRN
jgi:hypothetical protein